MTMLLILLAGIGAGFVGYAVGASSLVSYPALLALGIPPVLANASNTVGVIGTGVGGVLGARKGAARAAAAFHHLRKHRRGGRHRRRCAAAQPRPEDLPEFAVPPLILFSSLIIAVNPRGRMQARQAAAGRHGPGQIPDDATRAGERRRARVGSRIDTTHVQDPWWIWLGVAFVAVYSGYFGAGAGTCALAVLDAGKIGPFHQINALKTLIGTGANISASVIFIVRGVVDWPAAILLCVGCFIGGYIASPVTRRIPARIMRIAAVLAGIVLTVDLAMKTYL